jgi:hypothetical protein
MLVQSKSILAKLLASENLSVEHRKVPTAYFDTKNRVMVLPVWKDMSPELYDLLLGHETGHAIFTPNDGWHDQLKQNHSRAFKTYLNVIEDIRIEKCIQEKFPGLKVSFTKGYSELMSNDFFGVNSMGEEIDDLAFIDRINLHYKVGSYLNVKFSAEEKMILSRLDRMKTWEDVEIMAKELFEKGKKELRDKLEEMFQNGLLDDDEQDLMDGDFDEDGDWDDADDKAAGQRNGRVRSSGNSDFDDEPIAKTDEYFRKREKDLLQDNVKPYYYVNRPTPNLKNIIVPYQRIKKYYDDFSVRGHEISQPDPGAIDAAKNKLMRKFYDTNKKYISYLIKEFELRRNARQFARASISKTGELDVKKVHSYKFNDDLFKRMTVVPNGKSHGLVMFIDYSGSMTDNIQATIEQTLVLATFCRKVNIPFRVYAFTDNIHDWPTLCDELDIKDVSNYAAVMDNIRWNPALQKKNSHYMKFSSNDGELDMNSNRGFRLREYLSSEMSGAEYKNALRYWLLVGELMARRSYGFKYDEHTILPDYRTSGFEQLNGTPLNEAVCASTEILNEFKKKYRLDVVNAVFLTDGDSNESNEMFNAEKGRNVQVMQYGNKDCNVIVRDIASGAEGKKPPRAEMTRGLLNLLKATTGVNILGFFLVPGERNHRRQIQYRIDTSGSHVANFDDKFKQFKKDKFFMLNNIGYDDFYIIPGGSDLEIKDETMDVDSSSTKGDLKRAFMKMQKSKNVNRVLLNRFVEKIA